MRIAIIHHQFKLKGGMETYLLNLITGFHKQGDEVTVYVYKKNKIQNAPICEVNRKNLSWLPRPLRKYWFGSKVYKQRGVNTHDLKISLMRSFHQDIIICGGTHLGFLTYTQKKARLLDKWEIACERKSYQTSSIIVAHSKLLKEELVRFYGVPSEKILMSYPPIDTSKFNQLQQFDKEAIRKKYNIPTHKKAILFPSTGHKRKGFYILIEALKLLPVDEYELVIAGNQPAETSIPNINYVGFIEEMASLYHACDVMALPSYYEPFGLVVVESLECGTPVIVSKYVGAKDLIGQQEGIILDDMSASTIAEAIVLATSGQYTIRPHFAKRMALTVDAHVKQLCTTFLDTETPSRRSERNYEK